VCREDDGATFRHLIQLVYEHGTEAAQAVDHVFVVHDFVAHIDGRPEQLQRALHDIYGAIDACAEAARIGEKYFH
jgi:hypothetical protein